jgi:hypothetical protein
MASWRNWLVLSILLFFQRQLFADPAVVIVNPADVKTGKLIETTIGWQFGAYFNVTVSKLGVYDIGSGNESHEVGIWDENGKLLTSVVVPSNTSSTGELLQGFRYVPIEPLRLIAGQTYIVAAYYTQGACMGGDAKLAINTDPGIAWMQPLIAQKTNGLQLPHPTSLPMAGMPKTTSTFKGYFGPNFLVESTDPLPQPVPIVNKGLLWNPKPAESAGTASQPLKKIVDVDFNPGGKSAVNAVFSGSEPNQQWAQTFTIGVAGVLSEIDVFVKHFAPASGNLIMDLRRTAAKGSPITKGGDVLCSLSVESSSVPQSDDGIVVFNISSRNIRVVPGEKFAVVLRASEGASTFKWIGLTGNLYAGGQAFDRQTPDDDWMGEEGADLGIRTYVTTQMANAMPKTTATPKAIEASKPNAASLPAEEPKTEQELAVAEIKKLGGIVTIDGGSPGKPVTKVDLMNAKCTDADLERLKPLTQIQRLDLHGTQITDAGLEHLKGLAQLQKLDLTRTKVTGIGLEHLKGLSQLRDLGLSSTQITDANLEHIEGLGQIQILSLAATKVTDDGLEHLKGLTQLQDLNLNLVQTPITGEGLDYLKGLTQLRVLSLYQTTIRNSDLEHLKGLNQLQNLSLGATKVTDDGLEHLIGLSQLQKLNLTKTKVTDTGVDKLQRALPQCKIDYK